MTDQLTDRQTKILDYIRYVTKVRNYPPSVREIGEAVGLSSSSTVHNHLNQLERRGLIKRDPSKSRTVQLVADSEVAEQRRNAKAAKLESVLQEPFVRAVLDRFPGAEVIAVREIAEEEIAPAIPDESGE